MPSENFLRGTTPDQSTGSVWGSITMPGIRPLGFDKTPVEARIDGGKEEGKLGATLSRSVPLGRDLSVTWQNCYSVTQPLTQTARSRLTCRCSESCRPRAPSRQPAQARVFDEALRFNYRAVRHDVRGRHKLIIGRRTSGATSSASSRA